jgi:chitodextrinase
MQADNPSRTARLRFECDGSGLPLVREVVMPTPSTADSFTTILSDLAAAGYGTDSDAPVRYVVYYDDRISEGPGNPVGLHGEAGGFNVGTPGASSPNNRGAFFAVQYAYVDYQPWWTSLLHETFHMMGAVVNGSPEATGASHCNTDWDLMCYADGGPAGSATTQVCAYTQIDCGGNTYFNGGAPTGWLGTNWNVAAPYNRFIDFGTNLDLTAPERPAQPTVDQVDGHSARVSWTLPLDDIATARTIVQYRRGASGSWSELEVAAPATTTSLPLQPETSYAVQVVSEDAAGNRSLTSLPSPVATLADDVQPSAPSSLQVTPGLHDASLSWSAAADNVGVTRYLIEQLTAGGWSEVGSTIASNTSAGVIGLVPGASYTLRVVAVDAQGNRGESDAVVFSTRTETSGGGGALPPAPSGSTAPPVTIVPVPKPVLDATGPTKPRALRISRRSRSSTTLTWSPAQDPSGIKSYVVTYRATSTRPRNLTVPAGVRRASIPTRRGTRYTVTVRAKDAAGNLGAVSSLRFRA